MSTGGDHAIVIGGSMAGLAAAGVLSGFFDRVSIIDRDELPDDAPPNYQLETPSGRTKTRRTKSTPKET